MRKIIRAVIVDDEGLDRELLKNLTRDYCPSILIVGEASSAAEADAVVNALKPDLLFLDINMPAKNGFSLLSGFPTRPFLTVFTTGDDSYGIQAVKAGAFDYLLKPIDIDELQTLERNVLQHVLKQPEPTDPTLRIFSNGEHVLVRTEEIKFINAQGSYATLHLITGQEFVLSKNIKQLLNEITDSRLQRVHRSYIVNTQLIRSYLHTGNEGVLTLTSGDKISVSRSYKQALKAFLP